MKDTRVFNVREVTSKAMILSKPTPEYTEEARKNHVTGTVILLMVFSADGNVKGVIPIAALPDGLSAKAIQAARKIKFVPATKNGKPVSQFIRFEYNFNVH